MGNVVSMPLAGLLCQYGFSEGWDSVFYVIGESFYRTSDAQHDILILPPLPSGFRHRGALKRGGFN